MRRHDIRATFSRVYEKPFGWCFKCLGDPSKEPSTACYACIARKKLCDQRKAFTPLLGGDIPPDSVSVEVLFGCETGDGRTAVRFTDEASGAVFVLRSDEARALAAFITHQTEDMY